MKESSPAAALPSAAHEYAALRALSRGHRAAVEGAPRCGCFRCGAIFPPADIRAWQPEPDGARGAAAEPNADPAETALCPHCDGPTVVPEAAGVALSPFLLARMRGYYSG